MTVKQRAFEKWKKYEGFSYLYGVEKRLATYAFRAGWDAATRHQRKGKKR